MLAYIITGFFTSLALIVAIGAQNVFILRQGLQGQHLLPLVLFCGLADTVLIILGVAGLGVVIESTAWAMNVLRYGGALFLFYHGSKALQRAWQNNSMVIDNAEVLSLPNALLMVAGFTFLNPHVYLDTVILIGVLANQAGEYRWHFAAGGVLASISWFFMLGYGASLLSPWFQKSIAWKILDSAIALVMFSIGISLLLWL